MLDVCLCEFVEFDDVCCFFDFCVSLNKVGKKLFTEMCRVAFVFWIFKYVGWDVIFNTVLNEGGERWMFVRFEIVGCCAGDIDFLRRTVCAFLWRWGLFGLAHVVRVDDDGVSAMDKWLLDMNVM